MRFGQYDHSLFIACVCHNCSFSKAAGVMLHAAA